VIRREDSQRAAVLSVQHAGNVTSGRHRQLRFNLVGQRELKLGLLRVALERLNPALPPEAITAAVDELTRDPSSLSLEAANRQVYLLLKATPRLPRGHPQAI
jgi:type I site-specific restriction-modification system R (restriction) subunit